ncbi:MAG: RdgB/HAM1 family non-canonical purine NTP pyrophosphatase [Acidimicrobiales bacterium]
MTVPTHRLVVASANPDKVAEIAAILGSVPGIELVPRPSSVTDVEETGDTLVDNARLKARALVEATGLAAVADDTGLEVEALGGAPGVYSARFAGKHATYADNVAKLLDELERAGAEAPERRSAQFRCVALVAYPDGSDVWEDGKVTGTITPAPAGDSGFGYDPVFAPDGCDGRTFAQMSPAEKHEMSHRGRAFRALAARLTSGPGSSSSP